MTFPEITLIRELREEHEIVDRVVSSLYHWAHEGQKEDPGARARYISFFRIWVQGFHHEREEETLFPTLIRELDLKPDNGPIRVLMEEHEGEKKVIADLEKAEAGSAVLDAARELAHLLWEHVDKENSVVFAEGNERLVRSGLRDLKAREPNPGEMASMEDALKLVERWTPWDDEEHVRGDGCMACPAYGVSCGGIEVEWWNQWEWERHDSYQG